MADVKVTRTYLTFLFHPTTVYCDLGVSMALEAERRRGRAARAEERSKHCVTPVMRVSQKGSLKDHGDIYKLWRSACSPLTGHTGPMRV